MTNPIQNKTILLGVTGSIAAYKAAELASRLTQSGALVETILTASALRFIQPIIFQSVTGRKAFTDDDLWGSDGHVTHIGLGRAGDLFVIAPASANTIAKLAHGMGDNLLTVAALAARCPLLVAPAMDGGMYNHPATQANIELLRQRGVVFTGPAAGHLASGLVGPGRMAEPSEILGTIRWLLAKGGPLTGRKVMVTAGGTQEPIDPARVITNRSSGRQGYAIAQAALDTGAEVTLITAPTSLLAPVGAKVIPVRTATEMEIAVLNEVPNSDVLIMAAAVADFRPSTASRQKIKKEEGLNVIHLEPTDDILKSVAQQRNKTGFPKRVIGFAAESQHLLENARQKLDAKNLDMIVANDITSKDSGFEVESNQVTFLFPDGSQSPLPTLEKDEVAARLMHHVIQWFQAKP